MSAEDKIIYAEYFLEKIKDAKKREDLLPNLSAFLSETCSIPEYLLEDANVKFRLGIPLEHRLLNEFVSVCEEFLNLMKKFANDMKTEY